MSPSRLQPRLPGDLVTICLKALSKAGPRYASAVELADDLRRFLEGRTIKARAVSRPEKLWRWCRRNPGVATLSLADALILTAGFVISTYFALEENARAIEARDNARKAEQSRTAASPGIGAPGPGTRPQPGRTGRGRTRIALARAQPRAGRERR